MMDALHRSKMAFIEGPDASRIATCLGQIRKNSKALRNERKTEKATTPQLENAICPSSVRKKLMLYPKKPQ